MCCSLLCLFLVLPKTKNWLDLSAHFVPGFVCRLMLDTCSYQRWNRDILQCKELPISGDLPSPVGSQVLLALAKSQLECYKVWFNVNRRWWRCGLHSRTREAKSRDKILLTWWTMQRNIEFYSSICGFVVFYSKRSLGSWLRQPLFTRVYVLVISLGSTFSSGFIWLLRADISTTE